MSKGNCGRYCDVCKTSVYDLTEVSLQQIHDQFVGTDTCVRMTEDQVDVLKFMQPVKKFAIATSLVIGASVINVSHGQAKDSVAVVNTENMCLVKGNIRTQHKVPYSNHYLHFVIGDTTYETITNEKGYFEIYLPKHSKIEHHNIKKITQIKNQDVIDLGNIKIQVRHRLMGAMF